MQTVLAEWHQKEALVADEREQGSGRASRTVRGELYEEHLALGVSFDRAEDTGLTYPASYARE